VCVHGVSAIICMSKLIIGLHYHIMCFVEIIYIYLSYTYSMCNTIQVYGFCSYRFINLFKLYLM